jgi:hypothetical protein
MSRKMGSGAKDSALIEFHLLVNSTFTSGLFGLTMSPTALSTFSTRMVAEADLWAHFRVRALKFRLHPMASTVNNNQAAGFVGGVQDVTPGTVPLVCELIPSTFLSVESTVPTEWVSVSKKDLAGPLPWYKATTGSADATEEAPGVVCVVGSSSEAFILEMRCLVDFKTAVAPANSPVALQARAMVRAERQRLERERQARSVRALLIPFGSASNTLPTPGV